MRVSASELRDEIIAHPWEAIVIAFVVGAYVAFDRTGAARRSILASIGTMALGTVREAVTRAPAGVAGGRPASRFAAGR